MCFEAEHRAVFLLFAVLERELAVCPSLSSTFYVIAAYKFNVGGAWCGEIQTSLTEEAAKDKPEPTTNHTHLKHLFYF